MHDFLHPAVGEAPIVAFVFDPTLVPRSWFSLPKVERITTTIYSVCAPLYLLLIPVYSSRRPGLGSGDLPWFWLSPSAPSAPGFSEAVSSEDG
jgi:hypothetical protein